jgi:hypothetical protein
MKRLKAGVIFLVLTFLFFRGISFALMPPDKMEARNLEAPVILIGEVTETGKILLPEKKTANVPPRGLFVLKILHIIKGGAAVHGKKLIRILFYTAEKGKNLLAAEQMGIPPVRIKTGNLVVVYLKPSAHHPFYRPLAGGLSVVVIKP